MIYVRILGLDKQGNQQERGRIIWDGRQLRAEPAESPLLREILADEIIAPLDGKPKRLTAKDGPDFLAGLRYHYKSAYLRATDPES